MAGRRRGSDTARWRSICRGETWYLSRPPFNSGTVTLGSAGVGTRLAVWKDTSLQLEVGKPLDAPPGFKHGWTFEVGFKSVN